MTIWTKIDDAWTSNKYSVSDEGQVRIDKFDRILKPRYKSTRSMLVALTNERRGVKLYSVARLVANHFLEAPQDPRFDHPMHLDGEFNNCNSWNLVWRPTTYCRYYYRQFNSVDWFHPYPPVRELYTKKTFEHPREAAMFFGILITDIISSANDDGRATNPTNPSLNRQFIWS